MSDQVRTQWRRWLIVAAVLAATTGAAAALWFEVIEPRLYPRQWGTVESNAIFRSGQLHRGLVRQTLQSHQVRVVIDLQGDEAMCADQVAEAQAIEELGLEGFRFPLGGLGTGNIASYADAIAVMHASRRQGKPVLVHCAAGSRRTGGVVACYRVLVQGWTTRQAVEEMRRYDWRESENGMTLLRFMNENIGELSRMLVERGVIASVPDPLPHFEP